MAANTTIVLVHGIWHSPVTYAKFISALQKSGYEVYAPYLPSCIGARPPIARLREDTQLVRRLVEQLVDDGRHIIMVMHSYGGIVGCNAIENLDLKSRKAEGLEGGVAKLVAMAAYVLPTGTGVFDIVREMGDGPLLPTVFPVTRDRTFFSANAKMTCFGDVPDAEAEKLARTLSLASVDCMEDKPSFEGWKHVPLTYISTSKDVVLPPHYQKCILQKLEHAGTKVDVIELATGHSPWVSKTDEVVKIINDVAHDIAQV